MSIKAPEEMNGTGPSVFKWIVAISQILVIPMVGLMLWAWYNHEERINDNSSAIALIESNRFTDADQKMHEKEVAQRLLAVWAAIAEINLDMAKLPPSEFRKRVDDLDKRLREIEIRTGR